MINKIVELSAEIGKGQLYLQDANNQIKDLKTHIESQEKQINEMSFQLRETQSKLQAAGMRLTEADADVING